MRHPIAIEPGDENHADKIERVNMTLPRRVLKRLDAAARAAGETRSGYIARMALAQLPS